jgi:1-phosphofructokinase family hexose kinase
MDTTMRATRTVTSMGGKPADASFILGEMGIPSLALGFAAGDVGRGVEQMLEARGVAVDFIQVGGETRINTVIISEQDGGHATITTSTLEVYPEHIEELRRRYRTALEDATCVVIGGTQPDFVRLAKEHSVPVIFDASGQAMLGGLAAHPDFSKPNRDELAWLVERPLDSLEDAYRAGREMQDKHGTSPIVTLGTQGALAVLPERTYYIPPLEVEVVSPAGAGDGVLAGMAAALSRGDSLEEGLRLGFAAATAVLLQPGTADCRRADVERFLPQIELVPYP